MMLLLITALFKTGHSTAAAANANCRLAPGCVSGQACAVVATGELVTATNDVTICATAGACKCRTPVADNAACTLASNHCATATSKCVVVADDTLVTASSTCTGVLCKCLAPIAAAAACKNSATKRGCAAGTTCLVGGQWVDPVSVSNNCASGCVCTTVKATGAACTIANAGDDTDYRNRCADTDACMSADNKIVTSSPPGGFAPAAATCKAKLTAGTACAPANESFTWSKVCATGLTCKNKKCTFDAKNQHCTAATKDGCGATQKCLITKSSVETACDAATGCTCKNYLAAGANCTTNTAAQCPTTAPCEKKTAAGTACATATGTDCKCTAPTPAPTKAPTASPTKSSAEKVSAAIGTAAAVLLAGI